MQIPQLYKLFCRYPIVSTDSRNCPSGSIFFALKGDHFDGNDYIEQVLRQGAAYAVGDKRILPKDERIIIVDDVLQTLQNLANYHRKQMNAKVIGITGTNGKTTTKELIATALSSKYSVLFTPGNLNNHIGVPLTLLQLNPWHEFAVIEMGANHSGEIMDLCNITDPDYGIITNVGRAHLEGFGSFEGILRTKTELYTYLKEKRGIIFANKDNPILKDFYEGLSLIFYGTSSLDTFISGEMLNSSPTLSLSWKKGSEKNEIKTHLIGNYNLENVLAAICIASYFNVEADCINNALSDYIPSNNRSQELKTEKNHLILDAYNANPSSMCAALENFNMQNSYPKMVILGEMKELGTYSNEEHKILLEQLSQSEINEVILVGEAFNKQDSLILSHWKTFSTTEDLIAYLEFSDYKGFHILIKGSRGNRLERILPYL